LRYADLCNLLRKLRKEAEMRQVDLAAKLNQPQSFVSKYESGERRLDVVEVEAICQAIGISLATFARRFQETK